MKKKTTILGIETSCDETAAAVLQFDGSNFKLLSSAVASQVDIHKLTGGVVPEVAAREHVTTIVPTIKLALKKAKVKKENLDAIAVTAGPGLMPALMVGVDTANALSLSLNIPVMPVQHISGHIYANFINEIKSNKTTVVKKINLQKIKFPILALIVSGGHTEFVLMKDFLRFKKIGRTLDDAAGEAFDKSAKILGLPYPGGPAISTAAKQGDPTAYDFPRPKVYDHDLDFSFAGLKTAVLYKTDAMRKKKKLSIKQIADLAASTQEAIVDTLVRKADKALQKYQPASFTLGGGVSANQELRDRMSDLLRKFPQTKFYETKTQFATDNAAMIAAVGAVKFWQQKDLKKSAEADPQWELK